MNDKKVYLCINMCDFCSNEISTCGANPIHSKTVNLGGIKTDPADAVIACDKYKSPVDTLKKQFH